MKQPTIVQGFDGFFRYRKENDEGLSDLIETMLYIVSGRIRVLQLIIYKESTP